MNKLKSFILIEIIIFFSFIILDIYNIDSSLIKYLGIVFCFIYSMYNKNYLISLALFLTLLADLFLLIINDYYLLGVTIFNIVQIIYLYYLYTRSCKLYIPLRILLFIFIIVILYLNNFLTSLNLIATFYFVNLCINFLSSLNDNELKYLSLGLFLFILCDILVALFNILSPGKLLSFVSYLMWVFYLPSQVLITIHEEL